MKPFAVGFLIGTILAPLLVWIDLCFLEEHLLIDI